ncbi:MAG: glycoside hydrolase family 16 protein [Corallococcus sp.]|nr:glycoside hydrolase family 16 protein [Corallococcus sp.]MCM1359590.1 glycoside hydrolase family 16 protein [Corallococcus sp.]
MTKLKKTAVILVVILSLSLLLVGCNGDGDMHEIGGEAYLLSGVEMDIDNAFFDDFTNGVDPDNWYIGKQAWGAGENGGVIPENVNYTDDGVLVISGNGEYYTAGDVAGVGTVKDGSLTGGALISKFVTGPGRYQVRMKVLPRQGACTAFWTYAFDNETQGNHEIDIELPGGKGTPTGISFQKVLNTNYITVNENESTSADLTEVFGDKDYALNDGEWHTFGFDWYTNPKRVVYYIDGKVTAVSSISGTFVPSYTSRLWLGVWFPNNTGFVGDALFESDCMYVDWVKYVPFKDQPCTKFTPLISSTQVATSDEYPSYPVSTENVNKVANGDFEYVLKNPNAASGWVSGTRWLTNAETAALRVQFTEQVSAAHPEYTEAQVKAEVNRMINEIEDSDDASLYVTVDKQLGNLGSCGVRLTDIARFSQEIDSVYGGFQFDLSVAAMGKGQLVVEYFNVSERISQVTIDIDSAEQWHKYTQKLTAPANCYKLKFTFSTEYGGFLQLDDVDLRMV